MRKMRTIAQETRNRFFDYIRSQTSPVGPGRIKKDTKIHWRIVNKLLAEGIQRKEIVEISMGSKKYYEMVPSCYGRHGFSIRCATCRFGAACLERNPSLVVPLVRA